MDNVNQAQAKLKAVLAKYKIKLTKEQIAGLQRLYDEALAYDPSGQILLTAINRTEKTLEGSK